MSLAKNYFQTIFNFSKEGIAILDLDSRFMDFNTAYLDLLGFTCEELLTKTCIELTAPEDLVRSMKALNEVIEKGFLQNFEKTCIGKGGRRIVISMSVALLPDEKHLVINSRDITEQKELAFEATWQATHDPLTGLENRALLLDSLETAMNYADETDTLLAVCMLDLDDFKPINDVYGHFFGDQLLVALAGRLTNCLPDGSTVARLGGDEFVILLQGIESQQALKKLLNRLYGMLGVSYLIEGQTVQVFSSLGVTIYPLDDVDRGRLLRHADHAMYIAKQSGRNQYFIFNPAEETKKYSEHELRMRIVEALDNGELELYYQPKLNMLLEEVTGMEALIRWNHPEKGIILPLDFLPAVHHFDIIIHIGIWLISEALKQIRLWQKQGKYWSVSVNISAFHFQNDDFIPLLRECLLPYDRSSIELLEIELLESDSVDKIKKTKKHILSCQKMGIKVALDDFGTGYSSLNYLRKLPVDTLKIDKSFVQSMMDNKEALALVKAIIHLAHVFECNVVAEGVENAEQGVLLMKLGCYCAQGYLISRCMPAREVVGWSEAYYPPDSWVIKAKQQNRLVERSLVHF